MTIGTRETFERALKRARAHGGGAAAIDLGDNRYQVASSQGGTAYSIFVNSRGDFWCSCPAGVAELACWHTASVWLKRIAEQAGGQRAIPAVERAAAQAAQAAYAIVDDDAPMMDGRGRRRDEPDMPDLDDLNTTAESDADTRARIKRELTASISRWSEVDDDTEAFASIYGRKIA